MAQVLDFPKEPTSQVQHLVLGNGQTTSQNVPRSEGTDIELLSVHCPSLKIPSPFKMKKSKRDVQSSSESSDSNVEVSSGESIFAEPSEDEGSGKNHSWNPVLGCIGEFVVFKYEDAYFPGKIVKIYKAEATVT